MRRHVHVCAAYALPILSLYIMLPCPCSYFLRNYCPIFMTYLCLVFVSTLLSVSSTLTGPYPTCGLLLKLACAVCWLRDQGPHTTHLVKFVEVSWFSGPHPGKVVSWEFYKYSALPLIQIIRVKRKENRVKGKKKKEKEFLLVSFFESYLGVIGFGFVSWECCKHHFPNFSPHSEDL